MPNNFFRKMQGGEVYLGDLTLLGTIKEIDCGEIEYGSSTHNPLGSKGEMEFDGPLKPMEGSIDFESYIAEVMSAIHPKKFIDIQVHSNIDNWENSGLESQTPLITHLTVRFFKVPIGKFNQGEATTFQTGFKILAVKQVLDGETMREIDLINNIDNFMGQPVDAPIET